MNNISQTLISKSNIRKNILLNFISQAIPVSVAILIFPTLLKHLGTQRFGILTLIWAVISYFSLFDLGLSRALTQKISEKLGAGEKKEIPPLIWTALIFMLLLGLIGGITIYFISPVLVKEILKIPQELQSETLKSFYIISFSLPLIINIGGLIGILEAYQRFDLISVIRIPTGVSIFLGPFLILPISNSLVGIVLLLISVQLIGWCAYICFCFRIVPDLRFRIIFHKNKFGQLIRFGTWMSISNVISPIMVYMDRFIISALISVTAVAYYVTPYEIITKLWIVPSAMIGVLFPAFSARYARNVVDSAILFEKGVKYILYLLFPVVLIIVIFSEEILNFWLGNDFAQHSTSVLQWLSIGVFVNSLSYVPFAFLQGVGRPDITAKLHLVELPLYLIVLFWLISIYGIKGAAIAWAFRVAADALGLFILVRKVILKNICINNRLIGMLGVSLAILCIASFLVEFKVKIVFLGLVLSVFLIAIWFMKLFYSDFLKSE